MERLLKNSESWTRGITISCVVNEFDGVKVCDVVAGKKSWVWKMEVFLELMLDPSSRNSETEL